MFIFDIMNDSVILRNHFHKDFLKVTFMCDVMYIILDFVDIVNTEIVVCKKVPPNLS